MLNLGWTGSWPPAVLFFHCDLPGNGGVDAQLKHKTESQIGSCFGHARFGFTRAKSCVSAQKRKRSQASKVPRDDQNGSFYETFWERHQFFQPGESFHKYFVKAPGNNTQRRVS